MSKQFGPVVAGKFYPKEREKLLESIENCYSSPHGPGEIASPAGGELEGSLGIVVPHAGYEFSGPVAAHAYSWLAQFGRPSEVIIIGTNHSGFGPPAAIAKKGKWVTPLGGVEINEELANEISRGSSEIKNLTTPFSREHSLEVQLPFLQHLWGSDFSFVPICIKDQGREIAEEVSGAIEEAVSPGTLVIASTDFSHYEPEEVARDKDNKAIEAIMDMDIEGFYARISEYGISICGYGAVAALMDFAASRELTPEELKYATSGEVSGYGEEVVGYSAIGFE